MNEFQQVQPDKIVELARISLMREMWATLPDDVKAEMAAQLFKENLPVWTIGNLITDEIKEAVLAQVHAEIISRKPEVVEKIKKGVTEAIEKYSKGWDVKCDTGTIEGMAHTIKKQLVEEMKKAVEGFIR